MISPLPPGKRILRVPRFLDEIDKERALYPKGIVGSLKESSFDSARVERIELLAEKEEEKKKYYGILKHLFVAFCSESNLLNLADSSSNVIEVHALRHGEEKEKMAIESKLVLKRVEERRIDLDQGIISPYEARTPSLFVSSHWLDLMNLRSGDRVIISNPRENYEIPPPVAGSVHEYPR